MSPTFFPAKATPGAVTLAVSKARRQHHHVNKRHSFINARSNCFHAIHSTHISNYHVSQPGSQITSAAILIGRGPDHMLRSGAHRAAVQHQVYHLSGGGGETKGWLRGRVQGDPFVSYQILDIQERSDLHRPSSPDTTEDKWPHPVDGEVSMGLLLQLLTT